MQTVNFPPKNESAFSLFRISFCVSPPIFFLGGKLTAVILWGTRVEFLSYYCSSTCVHVHKREFIEFRKGLEKGINGNETAKISMFTKNNPPFSTFSKVLYVPLAPPLSLFLVRRLFFFLRRRGGIFGQKEKRGGDRKSLATERRRRKRK